MAGWSPTIPSVQKKVLIIEEEALVADALTKRLRTRGYAPTSVQGRTEALSAFESQRPDLVILSLTLPGEESLALCRELRARPLGALVPILFIGTGSEAVSSVKEAITSGADHFFNKPAQLGELLAKIVTYIGPGTVADVTEHGYSVDDDPNPTNDAGSLTGEWADLDELLRPDTAGSTPTSAGVPGSLTGQDTVDAGPVDLQAAGAANDDSALLEPPPPVAEPGLPSPHGAAQPPSPPPPARGQFEGPQAPMGGREPEWAERLNPGRPQPIEERGVEVILMDASRSRLSGRLEVASGGVLRRVFFESGFVVYADSSATEEDLSAHLAREGFVTRAALDQARDRAKRAGVSPEEILIEAGLLSPENVYDALRTHILALIFGLFGLEKGEAVVIRGGARPIDPVDLGHPTARLVLDGIRRKFGRLRLYRVFGTASTTPQRPAGVRAPGDLALRADESAVLTSADGRRTVLEISRSARIGEVDALAILYGFSVLGLVEGSAGHAMALVGMGSEISSRALAPQTADKLPGYAEVVQQKYVDVQETDYFRVLGLEYGATGAEVRSAFEDLKRRFDPHRVARDSPLWHQVVEISSVIEDAYTLLSNPRLRAQYESALN